MCSAIQPTQTRKLTIPEFNPLNSLAAENISSQSSVEKGNGADNSITENATQNLPLMHETTHQISDINTPEGRLSKFSSPEDVCREFLGALAGGDHIAASQMLTNIAQIETARANLQLESPGVEGSTWEVHGAEYATAEKQVAQVKCLLNQPGQSSQAQLTWMMRFQYNGWKISGMSIQLTESGAADLLSFENPKDLRRIQNSVAGNDSEITASQQISESVDR